MRASILDLSIVAQTQSAAEALRDTVALAREVDSLGYDRFWVAEHHGHPAHAGTSPPVLIARIAAATKRLRVGAGGVQLRNHNPIIVAETFATLAALFPGRIDLGIGRSLAAQDPLFKALHSGISESEDEYANKLFDLHGILFGTLEDDHPLRGTYLTPDGAESPDLWLLGSGRTSAVFAAMLGLPFAFAHFFGAPNGVSVVKEYRTLFKSTPRNRYPHVAIGVNVLCAESYGEADKLAACTELFLLNAALPIAGAEATPTTPALSASRFPNVGAALRARETDPLPERRAQMRSTLTVGTPQQVAEGLAEIRSNFDADELILVTYAPSMRARVSCYELLADALKLGSSTSGQESSAASEFSCAPAPVDGAAIG